MKVLRAQIQGHRVVDKEILIGVIIRKVGQWSIVDSVFGECHAPCMLKISFVDFKWTLTRLLHSFPLCLASSQYFYTDMLYKIYVLWKFTVPNYY